MTYRSFYDFEGQLRRYASSNDPQDYDPALHSAAMRAGLIDLPNRVREVPTHLLMRTLARLEDKHLFRRFDALDELIYGEGE